MGYLNVRMNNLRGRIPQSYAKKVAICMLTLNDNHLEGPLPPYLINCIGLMLRYIIAMKTPLNLMAVWFHFTHNYFCFYKMKNVDI